MRKCSSQVFRITSTLDHRFQFEFLKINIKLPCPFSHPDAKISSFYHRKEESLYYIFSARHYYYREFERTERKEVCRKPIRDILGKKCTLLWEKDLNYVYFIMSFWERYYGVRQRMEISIFQIVQSMVHPRF